MAFASRIPSSSSSHSQQLPIFLQPTELTFIVSRPNTHRQVLTLLNPYQFAVRFTVSTTAPNKYRVTTPQGCYIKPNCYLDLLVRLQPAFEAPSPTTGANTAATYGRDLLRVQMFYHDDVDTKRPVGHKDVPLCVVQSDAALPPHYWSTNDLNLSTFTEVVGAGGGVAEASSSGSSGSSGGASHSRHSGGRSAPPPPPPTFQTPAPTGGNTRAAFATTAGGTPFYQGPAAASSAGSSQPPAQQQQFGVPVLLLLFVIRRLPFQFLALLAFYGWAEQKFLRFKRLGHRLGLGQRHQAAIGPANLQKLSLALMALCALVLFLPTAPHSYTASPLARLLPIWMQPSFTVQLVAVYTLGLLTIYVLNPP